MMKDTMTTTDKTPIEVMLQVDDEGTVSAKNVYGFLELNPSNYSKWCKTNITDNQFAEENSDYKPFVLHDERNPNQTTDYKLSVSFAKKLCMKAGGWRGEEARDYFVKVEDKLKEVAAAMSKPACIEDIMIAQLQEMKSLKQKVSTLESRVEGIKDVVALNPNDWRKDTTDILNRIAVALGGHENIRMVRRESYDLLDRRFSVSLDRRLTNKRRRMAEEGICKSKRDNANQLDVIADDKKLIEGYISIIKEMAIKYGAVES